MKPYRKAAIVFLALLIAGAIRLPWELSLTRDLRAEGLLPKPLSVGVRDRIGQTGAAVALGGLRTLVATFLNLRAYNAYTESRWADVEDIFNTIVDLAPGTPYYWDTATQHLAYNAGSWYLSDEELSPLRRRELWRAYVHKGKDFLERGIINNPGDWTLPAQLGSMLSDSYKVPAFPDPAAAYAESAAAYRTAVETGKAPPYVNRSLFYSLARVPGKEPEALALGRKLLETKTNRQPSLLAVIFILTMHEDPSRDGTALAASLFSSDERAYRALSAPWLNKEDHYPVFGLAPVLKALETKLAVPWEKSVFNPVNEH